MTTNQLFFAILAVFVSVMSIFIGVIMKYMDAKLDPIRKNVDLLVQYMITHEGKIATLEERTKSK